MLSNPELAQRPCERCRIYEYKDDGKIAIQRGTTDTLLKRLPGFGPPCTTVKGCPKRSPAEARRFELSTRNRKTYQIYIESQATAGRSLTPAMLADPILIKNLAMVHAIVRSFERDYNAAAMIEATSLASISMVRSAASGQRAGNGSRRVS